MENNKLLKGLVQNYGFTKTNFSNLLTIDYIYPNYVQDGNNEEFRYSDTLKSELRARAKNVRSSLNDKKIVWTRK